LYVLNVLTEMFSQKTGFCLNIYYVIEEFVDIMTYFIWDIFTVASMKE